MDNESQLPIDLALADVRQALFDLVIDMVLAIHDGIFIEAAANLDANLVLVCAGVLVGHCQGGFTAKEISERIRMPYGSVMERLKKLIRLHVIKRIGKRYFIEPGRATNPPTHDRAVEILNRAYAVLGPYLFQRSVTARPITRSVTKSDTD